MISNQLRADLESHAHRVRKDVIEQVFGAQSGHIGGSLSCVEILVVLYFHTMKIEPTNPEDENRDRFVLSKGHCTPALYAVLAERGFFNKDELLSFRRPDSFLQGHPCMNTRHGIDMSTGSLGQGISAAVGMAIAAKRRGKNYRVYSVIGDGELQEGLVWESFMAAAHYKLDNLCAVVDNNGLQIDGSISEVMSLGDISAKFSSFGWSALEVNGHDVGQLAQAFRRARRVRGKPVAIIARTVKGKGVSFMENNLAWHGKAPTQSERNSAIAELEERSAGH
jgi:transketolase